MSKVKKNSLKAVQNRNRVNFHRRVQFILKNEIGLVNKITSPKISNSSREEPKQRADTETIGSRERLRNWALKYNISKQAVSDLLKMLIAIGMTWLPKDSRTLLSTPRQIHLAELTNGKLWYAYNIAIIR